MSNANQTECGIEESSPSVMEMTMMEGEEYYQPDDVGTWTQQMSDQLCRICAKPNQYLIPIFEGEGVEHQLEPKIQQHLPIAISETDCLPLQVCYQCASTLIAWSDLVVACVEADKKLHQIYELEEKDVKGIELLDEPILKTNKACETTLTASDLQSEPITPKTSRKAKKSSRKIGLLHVKSLMTRPKRQVNRKTKTPVKTRDGSIQETTQTPPDDISSELTVNGTTEEDDRLDDKDNDLHDCKVELETTQGYLCSSCGKSFTTRTKLRFHENWMHSTKPKKYACDLCGREYQHKAKFQLHQLKHSGTKNIVCEMCGKTFYEKTELRQHMTCHSLERPFACTLCESTFKRRTNLLTHEATMHGVVPDGHQSHPCPICGKTFLVAKLLADHLVSHSREFRCNRCGEEFVNKTSYSHHAKFSECRSLPMPEPRPCLCKVCGKLFKAKPNLRQHVRKVHEKGKNKFTCIKCSQECIGSRSYSYHVKHDCKPWPWKPRTKQTTAEKRTYQCKVCGKIFKANSNLSQHVRKVHEKDKHDKFCCTVCGKLFRWKISLDEHIRIHLNLKPCICKVCNKAFRTWSCLARHKKAHEDQRAYQCQVCGKAFKHSGALRAHLRIHSGIRPHPCGLCERSFIYYNEKIRHHHKVHSIHVEIKQEETQPIDENAAPKMTLQPSEALY